MKKININYLTLLTALFILLVLLTSCGKLKNITADDRLYFCERYDLTKGEINESDRFTTGTLTVMVKLKKPIGVNAVDINLTDTKTGEIIEIYPFSVNPENDYIYFDDVNFENPGKYKVNCLTKDGTVIVSGEVEIVSK